MKQKIIRTRPFSLRLCEPVAGLLLVSRTDQCSPSKKAATFSKAGETLTPGEFGLLVLVDRNAGSSQMTLARALGIPAVELNTELGDYETNHHATTDTPDKIDPRALSADTAGMALTALAIASADPGPGRRLCAQEIL